MGQYSPIITNLGKDLVADSIANGTPIVLKYLAWGDGNGYPITPLETQTSLVNEVYRQEVDSVTIDPAVSYWVDVITTIPSTVGGFYVREVGILTDNGTLFALASHPEFLKSLLTDGTATDFREKLILEVTNLTEVNLIINPSVVMATIDYVNEVNLNHHHTGVNPQPTKVLLTEGAEVQGLLPSNMLDIIDNLDINTHRIVNLQPGIEGTDGVNVSQLTQAIESNQVEVPFAGYVPYCCASGQVNLEGQADFIVGGTPANNENLLVVFDTDPTDAYGNDVTVIGSPTYTGGKFNSNGTTGVKYAFPTLGTGSWTIEGRFVTSATGTKQQLFTSKEIYEGSGAIELYLDDTNKLKTSIYGQAGSFLVSNGAGSKSNFVNSTAYHFCMMYDGSKYRIFVDGNLDYILTSSVSVISNITALLFGIYGNEVAYPLIGTMDDVRVSVGQLRYAVGDTLGTNYFTPPAIGTLTPYHLSTSSMIPVMTSDTTPSGVASASSIYAGNQQAWKAMNGTNLDINDCWISAAGYTSGWLQYKFTSPKIAGGYSLTSRLAGSTWNMCKDWTLQASNTGAFIGEQVTLDTRVGETSWGLDETRNFYFDNFTPYLYYRIVVTSVNGGSEIEIAEFGIFELISEVSNDNESVRIIAGSYNYHDNSYVNKSQDTVIPTMTSNTFGTTLTVPAMTSNSSNGFTTWVAYVGDSTPISNVNAYYAFTKVPNYLPLPVGNGKMWHVLQSDNGPIIINNVTIYESTGNPGGDGRVGIYGSNDISNNANWVALTPWNLIAANNTPTALTNSTAYKYYAFYGGFNGQGGYSEGMAYLNINNLSYIEGGSTVTFKAYGERLGVIYNSITENVGAYPSGEFYKPLDGLTGGDGTSYCGFIGDGITYWDIEFDQPYDIWGYSIKHWDNYIVGWKLELYYGSTWHIVDTKSSQDITTQTNYDLYNLYPNVTKARLSSTEPRTGGLFALDQINFFRYYSISGGSTVVAPQVVVVYEDLTTETITKDVIVSGIINDGTHTFVKEKGNPQITPVSLGYTGLVASPIFTSNTQDGFTLSSNVPSGTEYQMFDGNNSTVYYFTNGGWAGGTFNYMTIYNPVAFTMKQIQIYSTNPPSQDGVADGIGNFSIQGSNDGINWTAVASITNNNFNNTVVSINNSTAYNYYLFSVGINLFGGNQGWHGAYVNEVKFWYEVFYSGGRIIESKSSPAYSDESIVPIMTSNISGGWTATASNEDVGTPSYFALDNSLNTYWSTSAGNTTGWIKVAKNTGTFDTVGVELHCPVWSAAPYNFTIQDQANNILYTATGQTDWQTTPTRRFSFSASGISAIKINITQNNASQGLAINNIRILTSGATSDGDYWLDISKIPYQGYKYYNSMWNPVHFVKLGEVTKIGGILGAPISYAFNGEATIKQNNITTNYNYSLTHNVGSKILPPLGYYNNISGAYTLTTGSGGYIISDGGLSISAEDGSLIVNSDNKVLLLKTKSNTIWKWGTSGANLYYFTGASAEIFIKRSF
jgi:hypothetical protein